MVGQLVSRVAALENALADTEKSRRQLHNELVELRGNIRVFCRLRPSTSARSVAEPIPNSGVRLTHDGKPNDFHFDRVFPASASQAAVFDEVSDLVQSALDGYNVCLFSYGQTGSGKTYTMNGSPGNPDMRGIIPRAVAKILATSQKLRTGGWEFALEASFVEIYNENLKDLLSDDTGRNAGRLLDPNAIKHDVNSHTQIAGATKFAIETEEHAQEVLRRANRARSTDATAMNANSSRSHSVFTLHITGEHEASGSKLLGSLNLVDLAGSERLDRSQAEGQRQKETCAINKSLSSLGDIFQALSSKSSHIPYRNSKLTYLLQPCLGGSGKTLMFVNINPEVASAFESLCSLRFANKVNTVETAAKGGAKRHISSGLPPPPSTAGSSDGGRSASIGPGKRLASGPPSKSSYGFRSSSLPASKRRC